jgi:hypothetical protein
MTTPTVPTFSAAMNAAWERRSVRVPIADRGIAIEVRRALDDRLGPHADLVVVVTGDEELYASPARRRSKRATTKQIDLLARLRGRREGDEALSLEDASAEIDELIGGER